ncbi:MAG: NAD(P)-binding protein [Campylobacterota bacterium]|nr:NAD(P)-binding protein [Campylobacterota bacterium]
MKKNIVIVGGGIAGLISSLLLSKDNRYNIHIIEKDNELGGLLKAFNYGKSGKFDYGAHNILETGIKDLDKLLIGLLKKSEWDISSAINSQRRTLTGLYYDNELYDTSAYIDIRKKEKIKDYIVDFMLHFENKEIDLTNDNISAYTHAKQIFGLKIADDIIVPAFLKLFGTHPKDMNNMAMYLTPMLRVVMFDKKVMDDLLLTEKISTSLSYPDQNNLPQNIRSSLKAYYPKKYGIYRVIESIKNKLLKNNVKIHLNTTIIDIKKESNSISKVKLDNNTSISKLKYCIWSVGYLPLTKLLNINISDLKYDKHPKTVITNILIDKPLNIGKLSYFYCYDNNFKTFRLNNYINYCSGAKRDGLYPVSIEMILKEEDTKDTEKIRLLAIDELKRFNILKDKTNISFSKTEILDYGFPLLSQNNISSMNKMRNRVRKLNITNLINIGVLAEKNLFFEGEIKKDAYKKMQTIINN